ncbi:MAG: L,D-transpeptidase family protein [Candidatus Latescibacteria bacterium]|nr:L,D-transpeptidase family protein [Candidatus Latescibacterota bacterium]
MMVLAIIFVSFFAESETDRSPNLDVVLRRIGEQYVRQTVEGAESFDEAASMVGIDSKELQKICIALNIDTPFEQRPAVEPVRLSQASLLADNDYVPDVFLSYGGLTPYFIIVDKSSYTLYLLRQENGRRTIVDSFACKTGRNHGDKLQEGDQRTPEGVFFFTSIYGRDDILKLVGSEKAYLYGDKAFATNFPNTIDRIQGKDGGGIWLHGTDRSFEDMSPNDTRGCVVTTNETIAILSDYITLYSTPMIIVDTLNMVPRQKVAETADALLEQVEDWRKAWAGKKLDDYSSYYSDDFHAQGMNRDQWISRKKNIFNAYRIDHIALKNISVYRHNEGFIIQFVQDYAASNTSGAGIKTLYLMRENNSWCIVTENFRRI